MSSKSPILKQTVLFILVVLSLAAGAMAQSISAGGSKSENQRAIDQFNTDVAAWNTKCKATRTPAEEAWCKKERARIDAKKAELVALGALKK